MTKKELLKSLLEAAKEPLRLLLLAIIPVLLAYFETISYEWAGILVLVLRLADKVLHEVGKATDNEVLKRGITRF